MATGLAQREDLGDGHVGRRRDLLVGRIVRELRRQVALDPREPALALLDVRREADRPRRVRQAALDALTDPERGVRRELEALAPVELLGGADQAERALLDEVAERQAEALVAPSLGDDEAQVRIDHAVLRSDVTALDALGELDLLGCRQQRVARRLVEEGLQRIGRHLGLDAGAMLRRVLGRIAAPWALRWCAVLAATARARRCGSPGHAFPFRCIGAPLFATGRDPTARYRRIGAARRKTGEEAVKRMARDPHHRAARTTPSGIVPGDCASNKCRRDTLCRSRNAGRFESTRDEPSKSRSRRRGSHDLARSNSRCSGSQPTTSSSNVIRPPRSSRGPSCGRGRGGARSGSRG